MSHIAASTSLAPFSGSPAMHLAAVNYAPPAVPLPSGLSRACLAAKIAADNKGTDVQVLALMGLTPMFDYFVLATGQSRRQVHTIVEEVDAALRDVGDKRMAVEGYDVSKWVVQDYGDVLVHVFDADTRDYYKIEDLWSDARRVDWEREGDYELAPRATPVLAAAPDDDADDDVDTDDDVDSDDVDDDDHDDDDDADEVN